MVIHHDRLIFLDLLHGWQKENKGKVYDKYISSENIYTTKQQQPSGRDGPQTNKVLLECALLHIYPKQPNCNYHT